MIAGTRFATGVALLLAAVVGCTTQAPTPSPGPSNSPLPSATAGATQTPTVAPSPTVGPTTESGFPTSILGLTVHSVAEMHQLAADGALDGRLAAVGGYWGRWSPFCPYRTHRAILDGFCTGGAFADDPEVARQFSGDINSTGVPLVVPETANATLLTPAFRDPVAVVLIIHGADSRAAQCEAALRAECQSRLVMDDVAWVNGQETMLTPDTSDGPGVALTFDELVAAAVQPGEQLVTAYPLVATDLNDADPRLLGQGSGIVWYARVTSGAPDANGTAPGKAVLIADATGSVVTTLPLAVDAGYQPARVVLDSKDWESTADGAYPRFTIARGTTVVTEGDLGSGSTPLALEPGEYTVHAFIGRSTGPGDPIVGPICDLPLTVAAGDDVAYYAQFRQAPLRCTWKEGAWPFN